MFEKIEKFLVEVLIIIEYREDKKKFAKKFIENCIKVSLSRLIDGLEEKERINFEKEIKQRNKEKVIKKYFKKDFIKVFEEVFKGMFEDFIRSIKGSLSYNKKEELKNFLSKMVK